MPRVIIATIEEARSHLTEWGSMARVEMPKLGAGEADTLRITSSLRGWLRPPPEALSQSVAASRVEAVLRLLDGFDAAMAAVVRAEYGIKSRPVVKRRWLEATLGQAVGQKEYASLLGQGEVFVASRLRPVRAD